MNEQFIRGVAARFGLNVLKRITTGTERAHFATFELSGKAESITPACAALREEMPPVANVRWVSNPDHADHGTPYVEIESVWCDRA